jgi:hypothetical protein
MIATSSAHEPREPWEQAATFMLLVHGTDIDATWNVLSKSALSAASIYEHIYLERWYGIASNILSEDTSRWIQE